MIDNDTVKVGFVWMLVIVVLGVGCGILLSDEGPRVVIEGNGVEWITSTQGRLVFVATDTYCEKLLCDVELNDAVVWTMLVDSGVQAQCGMTLQEGMNAVRVRVTDAGGNSAWSSVYVVYVDQSAPEINVVEFRVKGV